MMESNTEAFNRSIEVYNLRWVIDFAKDTRAVENAYHTPDHCIWVAERALVIYQGYIGRGLTTQNDPQVALLIAALMHDYDHLGGTQSCDHENIQLALKGMRQIRNVIVSRHGQGIYDLACELIRITEYPFIHKPVGQLEKALRDADVLYSFSEHGAELVMEGLRSEMSILLKRDISYQEMYDGQVDFYNSMHLYTNYAQFLVTQLKTEALRKMHLYVQPQGKE